MNNQLDFDAALREVGIELASAKQTLANAAIRRRIRLGRATAVARQAYPVDED